MGGRNWAGLGFRVESANVLQGGYPRAGRGDRRVGLGTPSWGHGTHGRAWVISKGGGREGGREG
jgi:hypothetical protein